jgi:hypothetical protein
MEEHMLRDTIYDWLVKRDYNKFTADMIAMQIATAPNVVRAMITGAKRITKVQFWDGDLRGSGGKRMNFKVKGFWVSYDLNPVQQKYEVVVSNGFHRDTLSKEAK